MSNTTEFRGLIISLITIVNDNCGASLVDFSADHFKTCEQNLFHEIPMSGNNLNLFDNGSFKGDLKRKFLLIQSNGNE